MRTREIIVETSDLSIGYLRAGTRKMVMEHLMLSACKAELVALIGRNGSGKSTLLRTLVALQPPLAGTVKLHGRLLSTVSASERPRIVSFTSTEQIAMHNVRVYDVVSLGRFPYTNWIGTLTRQDHEAVNEALEVTGLKSLAHRRTDSLSDGERQRVLIARSLAQETELLVMDEPTAFLDLPSRYEIVSLLRKLTRDKGRCVIYSTHDLDTAINEADRIWLMAGSRVSDGSPEDLMLSNTLAEAFESPMLSFSRSTGTFTFIRARQTGIAVEGTGMARKLTEKALHRAGYKIIQDANFRVLINEIDDTYEWILIKDSEKMTYRSLYELINHLPDEV